MLVSTITGSVSVARLQVVIRATDRRASVQRSYRPSAQRTHPFNINSLRSAGAGREGR
jgi:hypothetical protein